jgi:hypothetical protein
LAKAEGLAKEDVEEESPVPRHAPRHARGLELACGVADPELVERELVEPVETARDPEPACGEPVEPVERASRLLHESSDDVLVRERGRGSLFEFG